MFGNERGILIARILGRQQVGEVGVVRVTRQQGVLIRQRYRLHGGGRLHLREAVLGVELARVAHGERAVEAEVELLQLGLERVETGVVEPALGREVLIRERRRARRGQRVAGAPGSRGGRDRDVGGKGEAGRHVVPISRAVAGREGPVVTHQGAVVLEIEADRGIVAILDHVAVAHVRRDDWFWPPPLSVGVPPVAVTSAP